MTNIKLPKKDFSIDQHWLIAHHSYLRQEEIYSFVPQDNRDARFLFFYPNSLVSVRFVVIHNLFQPD